MSIYRQSIREHLASIGRIGIDPRHVEAYMRLEHSTLDSLSREQFRSEVATCAACVDAATASENESLAQSFGLRS